MRNGLNLMHEFKYNETLEKLFTPSIVANVTKIHEGKGILPLATVTGQNTLERLNEIAKIQSAGASSRIEGIKITEKHLRELMDKSVRDLNANDRAVLGYRYVLETIDQTYNILRVSPAIILQLHDDMFRYMPDVKSAGKWRGSDRMLMMQYGQDSEEASPKRFHGVKTDAIDPSDIPSTMRELCNAYNTAVRENVYSPLIISIIFVLDFICIFPFEVGMGRMARLLALLLFNKNDFTIGRYISIDAEIERTKDEYFAAIKASAKGWEDGTNNYLPFIEYMLGVLNNCYAQLTGRTSALSVRGSNEMTIRRYFQSLEEPVSKIEILEANPTMSQKTLERILQKMQREGSIERVGAARATKYQRIVSEIPLL